MISPAELLDLIEDATDRPSAEDWSDEEWAQIKRINFRELAEIERIRQARPKTR